MDRPVIRWYFDVRSTRVLDDRHPIHFAGATLFVANGANVPVTVSLHESSNGTVWNILPFSTHSNSGNLSIQVAEQSYAALHFVSYSEYVRVTVQDANGNEVPPGVFCYLCEYPPLGERAEPYS